MADKAIQLSDGTNNLYPVKYHTTLTSSDNIDNCTHTMFAWCQQVEGKPDGTGNYGHLVVESINETNACLQTYYEYGAYGVQKIYVRTRVNNAWQPWRMQYTAINAGDTYTQSDGYIVVAGHITSGITEIQFCVPCNRFINASTATVTDISCSVRVATGGYLVSGKSGNTVSFASGDYDSLVCVINKSSGLLRFTCKCNSYWKIGSSNAPNNSVVAVSITSLQVTFS